jgi:hypothetical protein
VRIPSRLLSGIFFGLLGSSLALSVPRAAHAATPIPLQITPARVATTLTPGKLLVGEVEVFNKSTSQAFELTTSVQDLRMTGLSGEFTYSLETSPLALHHHVRLSDAAFTLGPGEAKKVAYQVLLPRSAPPGGYYGVIFVRTQPQDLSGTGVAVSGQVGTLLLFNVAGEMEDRGLLQALSTKTDGERVRVEATFVHRGKVEGTPRGALTRATGEVRFATWYGRVVLTKPLPETFLLPEARRVAGVDWKPPRAGIYRATVKASFGSHPPEARTVTLLFLPSRTRAALIVMAGLAMLLLYRYRGRIFPRAT